MYIKGSTDATGSTDGVRKKEEYPYVKEEYTYVYDPEKRSWIKVPITKTSPIRPTTGDFYDSDGNRVPVGKLVWDENLGTWVPSSTYPKPSFGSGWFSGGGAGSSSAAAQKKYKEIEYKTLEGDASVVPTSETIKIKVCDTVTIDGVGKFLSGDYFVAAVSRNLDKDSGYSQSVKLIKTGFGDSTKKSYNTFDKLSREDVGKYLTPSMGSFVKGDTIKIYFDEAVYSGEKEGIKIPSWIKSSMYLITDLSSDNSRALLKGINAWVYTKDIRKV